MWVIKLMVWTALAWLPFFFFFAIAFLLSVWGLFPSPCVLIIHDFLYIVNTYLYLFLYFFNFFLDEL